MYPTTLSDFEARVLGFVTAQGDWGRGANWVAEGVLWKRFRQGGLTAARKLVSLGLLDWDPTYDVFFIPDHA